MEQNNKGRWVKQINDEMVEELLKLMFTTDKLKSFKKILKITRKENEITVLVGLNVKSYMSYAEKTITISDFKVFGTAAEATFPEFMIKHFGEEYANEFLAYAEDYVNKNAEQPYAKRLAKVIDKIPSMVEKYQEEQEVQTV